MAHYDILGIGDSIAEGYPAYTGPENGGPSGNINSQPWPYLITALNNPAYTTYYNAGIAGNSPAQVLARLEAQLIDKTPHRVYVNVGVNNAAPWNPPRCYGDLQQWDAILQLCDTYGAELIVNEIMPATVGSLGFTSVNQYWIKQTNAYLLEWAIANNVKVSVGLYNAMEDPNNPDNIRPEYTTDGLHITVSGYAVMGATMANARVPTLADIPDDWIAAKACAAINSILIADLTLTAGTYYVSSHLYPVGYTLTFDTTDGDVVIKTAGNASILLGAGNGTVVQTGTNKVIFTSKNDNSRGDTTIISTGNPSASDQTVGYLLQTNTGTYNVTLTNWELYYCTPANGTAAIGWAWSSPGTWSLSNGTIDHVTISTGKTAVTPIVGSATNTLISAGTVNLDNIYIGSNCVCNSASNGYLARIVANNDSTIRNCTFVPSSSYTWNDGLVAVLGVTNKTLTVDNCIVDVKVSTLANIAALIVGSAAPITSTYTVKRCLVRNPSGHGIYSINLGGGTVATSVTDCIMLSCSGYGLHNNGTTVTHTYNDYYGNGTNAFEALHATEITTNPAIGNLRGAAVINTTLCNRPNGYAVNNTALENIGSDTFDNLSINESIWTSNGFRYDGHVKVTIGPMYALSTFSDQSITITGGDMTWATVFTAGTYRLLSGLHFFDSYIDFNCAAGPIVFKPKSNFTVFTYNTVEEEYYIYISQINSTFDRRLIVTSYNDDSVGVALADSTGSPVTGDVGIVFYCNSAYNGSLNIYHGLFKYSSGGIVIHAAYGMSNPVSMQNTDIRYCSTSTYFFGNEDLGSEIYLYNVSMDETNTMSGAGNYAIYYSNLGRPITIRKCRITPSGTCEGLLYTKENVSSGAHTRTVEDSLFVSPNEVGHLMRFDQFSRDITVVISRCVILGGPIRLQGSLTLVGTVSDTIVRSASTGFIAGGFSSSLTLNNCGYYGGGTRSTGSVVDNSPIDADPQFGNLPAGATLATGSVLPDGYAVTNLTAYEGKGSGTYASKSIDPEVYSPTGYLYSSSRNITPGVMYELSSLAAYYTMGGALTQNTTWYAGTYHVTSSVTFGAYSLTLDTTDGDIIIKPVSSIVECLYLSAAGGVSTTGHNGTVYVTSVNDNTKGVEISGSTGTPATGDCQAFITSVAENAVNLRQIHISYGRYKGIINWRKHPTTNVYKFPNSSLTLRSIVFKYCTVENDTIACFIGVRGSGNVVEIGDVDISGVSIDTTNTSLVTDMYLNQGVTGKSVTLSDIYITASGVHSFNSLSLSGITTLSIHNCLIDVSVSNEGIYGLIDVVPYYPPSTTMISNCILRVDSDTTCVLFYDFFGLTPLKDRTFQITDVIMIRGGLQGINPAVKYTRYFVNSGIPHIEVLSCAYYNFGNLYEFEGEADPSATYLESGTINADPMLGSLPYGAVQAGDCVFPNGYVVRNMYRYEGKGSQTYTEAGIDTTTHSPTGYQYAAGQRVTPGVPYKITTFARRPSLLWPSADV